MMALINERAEGDCHPLISDEHAEEEEEDEPPGQVGNRPKHHVSLARAPTTPLLAMFLIPILTIATHAMFFYGQTAPMWQLYVSQHIHVFVNATTTESKYAFDTLGIPLENEWVVDDENDIQDVTFSWSIRELWKAKGWTIRALPRTTAILLVLASGVWPHLKLFLLNIMWLFPMRSAIRRKRFLHSLSALGKWSLADVLAVCVMIGVLHLEWHVQPDQIQQGVIREMPLVIRLVQDMYSPTDLCTMLLAYSCEHPHKLYHWTKCKACTSLVYEAYNHPSWAKSTGKTILRGVQTSGGGLAELSVKGMRGIYVFCLAVISSILLSFVVDIFDVRARKAQARLERLGSAAASRRHDSDSNSNTQPLSNNHFGAPSGESSHEDDVHDSVEFVHGRPASFSATWIRILLKVASVVTLVVVILAICLCTMQRKAQGAIQILLHDILGIDWTRRYSLQTLVQTTGLAGGWDWLLMATLSLFLVVGPAVRAVLCVVSQVCTRGRFCLALTLAIDFIGAFCAWEVVVAAVIMVGLIMPNVTDTIVNIPECELVSPDGTCLKVEFQVMYTFGLVVLGGLLLVSVAAVSVYKGHQVEARHYTFLENQQEIEIDHLVVEEGMFQQPNGFKEEVPQNGCQT